MAHIIAGLDLGAQAIKVVLIEAGFRHSRVVSVFEEPVAAGPEPLAERQKPAIEAAVARLPAERTVYTAMPGDLLAIRVLDLPFSDARKVEQVVGFELESQLLNPLDEVVYDHLIMTGEGGTSPVLAVAARISDVGAHLATLKDAGVDPRSLFAASLIYRSSPALAGGAEPAVTLLEEPAVDEGASLEAVAATLAPGTLESDVPRGGPVTRLIVDIGHSRTNVCILAGGDALFGRTFPLGGANLTAGIAQRFGVSAEQAERAKCERGVVMSSRMSAGDPGAERLSEALHDTLGPWMRELRQTLASFRARSSSAIGSLTLLGGGARLRGLAEWLEEELSIPVQPFVRSETPTTDDLDERFALAEAIAWAGARGRREIDLRQGAFVYRASFSILRQRAWHLVGLAAALLVTAGIDGTMALSRLTQERAQLEVELKRATQDLFGSPRMDARQVTAELRKSFKDEMVALPKLTAFDVFDEISKRAPASEALKLEVQQLEIRPKKTFMKGTIASVTAVDEMVSRLKEIECFDEIQKGAITEVSGGGKQFSLTIATRCP